MISGVALLISSSLNLNKCLGKLYPFARGLSQLSLRCLKNGCYNANNGLSLYSGLYFNKFDIKSIAYKCCADYYFFLNIPLKSSAFI
jgi:hypothetical protein